MSSCYWWTPEGWVWAEKPPAYRAYQEARDGSTVFVAGSSDDALCRAGYVREDVLQCASITEAGKMLLPQLFVHPHRDGHLWCDVLSFFSKFEEFYVAPEHAGAFLERWQEVLGYLIQEDDDCIERERDIQGVPF